MDEWIRHLRVQINQEEEALSQFMLAAQLEQGKRLGKIAAYRELLMKIESVSVAPSTTNEEVMHDHDLS